MGREDMTPEEIDEAADHGLVRACVRKSCKPKAGYPGGPPRAFWGAVSPPQCPDTPWCSSRCRDGDPCGGSAEEEPC